MLFKPLKSGLQNNQKQMEWRVLTSDFEVDRLYNRLSLTSSPCAEITNGEEQPTSEPGLVPSHLTPPALKTLVRCFLVPVLFSGRSASGVQEAHRACHPGPGAFLWIKQTWPQKDGQWIHWQNLSIARSPNDGCWVVSQCSILSTTLLSGGRSR